MKIIIDARWIFPEISGIGSYTRELIRNLAGADDANEYILLFNDAGVMNRTIAETRIDNSPNFNPVLVPWSVFSIRGQLLMPAWLRKQKADVFHSTNYMIPLLAFPKRSAHATKCIVTIHDMIPLILPKHLPKSKKTRILPVFRRLIREIGARADLILADSNTSRSDIIKHAAIDTDSAARVRTVYCGVSEHFRPLPGKEPRRPDSKDMRTVLYVGRADPYKNVATLICALAIAQKKASFPLRLLVAGSPDPRYPETKQLATELGLEESVVWTGYMSDNELVKTYQQADILAHASRYEGFGLQVAEAMACGLPVVCSDAGSLPEIVGDAAVTLKPDDVRSFANRILEVLSDAELWRSMSAKGIARASRFTWRTTALETMALYKEIASDAAVS